MKIQLGTNSYGKNAINLSKIIRHADHHVFRQISVNVILAGDFEKAHVVGDNSLVLPTDTQKNTVYALAQSHFTGSIEDFGKHLAKHFMSNNPQLSAASIEITEYAWKSIKQDTGAHPYAFINGGCDKHVTTIVETRDGIHITSGIKDLLILKTIDSSFTGYPKDQYTTLQETNDRIMSTQCEVTWEYTSNSLDFDSLYVKIRASLLQSFATHKSLSVQHTLYAMGEQVLKDFPDVKEISLKLPNKHHIPMNLEPFGMENRNDIFIATEEPFGFITGTVTRQP